MTAGARELAVGASQCPEHAENPPRDAAANSVPGTKSVRRADSRGGRKLPVTGADRHRPVAEGRGRGFAAPRNKGGNASNASSLAGWGDLFWQGKEGRIDHATGGSKGAG